MHSFLYLNFIKTPGGGTVNIPILQLEKLRQKSYYKLAQGQKSSTWHQQGFESKQFSTRTYILNHCDRVETYSLKLEGPRFEFQLLASPVPLISLLFNFFVYKVGITIVTASMGCCEN